MVNLVDIKYTWYHDISLRIKDLIETNRKLEERITDLTSQVTNGIETNKLLIDEHQALQTLYNAHERKLKESQTESDQLVSAVCFFDCVWRLTLNIPARHVHCICTLFCTFRDMNFWQLRLRRQRDSMNKLRVSGGTYIYLLITKKNFTIDDAYPIMRLLHG